jgi:3D (Asp-Asp-Asp) domain-containing protein
MRFRAASVFCALVLVSASAEAAAPGRHRQPPRTLRVAATAYCRHGVTRTGNRTRRGTVAADPRVLPMGTTVRLPPRRGLYTVSDTGSTVKGRRLDIYMPSCREARQFGRRHVRVEIVRPVTR